MNEQLTKVGDHEIHIKLLGGYTAKANLHTFMRLGLDGWRWHAQVHKRAGKVYVQGYCGGNRSTLHRMLTGAKKRQQVDHKDNDGLNNLDNNLRVCKPGQNRANSRKDRDNRSGYKGVSWAKTSRKWMAQIIVKGKKQYLGVWIDKERAARAYDRAAIAAHGEFAGLNFPVALPPRKRWATVK